MGKKTENDVSESYFELVVYPRDGNGKILSPRTIKTDSSFKLWSFWQNNKGKSKKQKQKKNKNVKVNPDLPTGDEAVTLMNQIADYAETTQKERDSHDDANE